MSMIPPDDIHLIAENRRLRIEIERLRAEVASCDGHGYLREQIAELEALLAKVETDYNLAFAGRAAAHRLLREVVEAWRSGVPGALIPVIQRVNDALAAAQPEEPSE